MRRRASRSGTSWSGPWRVLLLALCLAPGVPQARQSEAGILPDTERRAVEFSQAAIGRTPDDIQLTDSLGKPVRLSDFRGKPLVISMVFTSCAYSCSVTTRYIDRVVREARNALGQDSFSMLSIGFDTPVDTPPAMRAFADRHAITDPDWHFLGSGDAAAMARLMQQLGVLSEPSPRGFDHTVQLSVIDADGILYRQVYGEVFDTPLLVEPLKDLVLGRPAPDASVLQRLQDRVRLFCTVYDPKSGRYYFDYSLFVGIFISMAFLGFVVLWLAREIRFAHSRRGA